MIVFDRKEQKFYSTKIQSSHGWLTREGTKQIPREITTANFYWVKQVHGNTVLILNNEKDFGRVTTKEADGLVYKKDRHEQSTLSIRTADCVPVILEDHKHQIVGVVHSGWKGCSVNVVAAAVKKFLALGSALGDITVAIGPAIGSCCYHIPLERQELLQDLFAESIEKRENLVKFNLVKTIFLQLQKEGMSTDHIDWKFFCTSCQKDDFSSCRREGKGIVNMISYISI